MVDGIGFIYSIESDAIVDMIDVRKDRRREEGKRRASEEDDRIGNSTVGQFHAGIFIDMERQFIRVFCLSLRTC